jgi:hypothetical protein
MSKLALDQLLQGMPAGAWVAISERHQKALAYGTDARLVLNEARGLGESLPLMLRVPEVSLALAA